MKKLLLPLCLGIFILSVAGGYFLSLKVSSGDLSASDMRLERYTGQVSLSNGTQSKDVVEGARLVSGDDLKTLISSKAYLLLDATKVLAVDQESNIRIQKEEEDLEIQVLSGSVFFNVSAPLTSEESLEFHTNNVVTGVRGTSGVISYDPTSLTTQIAVLSGSVTGETATETKYVNAGEVGIVTTHLDGTVSFEIVTMEETPLYHYFTDDFIDYIQPELTDGMESSLLSDTLRESTAPQSLVLPEHIQVLGDARSLSPEQANAFAQAIQQSGPDYTMAGFVDGGNGIPLMILAQATEFYHAGNVQVQTAVDCLVIGWTGTQAVTYDQPNSSYLSSVRVTQEGTYLVYSSDLRGASDVQNVFGTYYLLGDGQRGDLPEFINFRFYYLGYNDRTVADVRATINDNGDVTLADALASPAQIDALAQELLNHNSYEPLFYTIHQGGYTLNGRELGETLQEFLCYDHTSIYWNAKDQVYAALKGD